MAWRTASYRGVAFHVDDEETTGGRRNVRHEYVDPAADRGTWIEDLGAQPASITLRAYVLGADYLDRARELADALNMRGPGRLVLPRGGERDVAIESWSVRYETRSGRSAVFSITAVEAGAPREALTDHTGATLAASEVLASATKSRFQDAFSVLSSLDWVEAEAREQLTAVVTAVQEALGPGLAAGQAASRLARLGGGIIQEAGSLVRQPSAIPDRLAALLGIASPGGTLRQIWGGLTAWRWAGGRSYSGSGTPSLRQAAANRAAMDHLVIRTSLARAAVAATAATYATEPEVDDAADFLAGAFDRQLDTATADVAELTRLRTAVLAALAEQRSRAAELIPLDLPETAPALVVAWRLYGDTPAAVEAGAADLVRRNRIPHPLFVPAGRILQVRAP